MALDDVPPAASVWVRLLPDGRVVPTPQGRFPAPAVWKVSRCYRHNGSERCTIKASVNHQSYVASVAASLLMTIEVEDGVIVRLERSTRR